MSKKEININNYNDDAIQVLEGLDAVQMSRDVLLIDRWSRASTIWSGKWSTMRSMKPHLVLVLN